MLNVDAVVLCPEIDIKALDRPLELSALLGAKSCTVVVTDEAEARVIDNFAALCTLAASYDLSPSIEFMAFSTLRSPEAALRVVENAGQPNGKIVLDLLHLVRNSVPVESIAGIPPTRIGYAQVCDGPAAAPTDPWQEAVGERMAPGDGEFPVAAFLAQLPPNLALAVEVPQDSLRKAGISIRERVRRLAFATRRFVGDN